MSSRTRAFDRIPACAWVLLLLATTTAGCNRDLLGSGDQCTRSSECAAGLVCVEGACGSSLAGLENPGTVPMVMMGGEEMPMEGNADAGAIDDAGASMAGTGSAGTGSAGTAPPAAGAGGTGPTDAGAMGAPDAEPGFQP